MFENLPGSSDEHLLRLSVQKEILLLLASSSSWLQFSVYLKTAYLTEEHKIWNRPIEFIVTNKKKNIHYTMLVRMSLKQI
jgi:hypothetical protein